MLPVQIAIGAGFLGYVVFCEVKRAFTEEKEPEKVEEPKPKPKLKKKTKPKPKVIEKEIEVVREPTEEEIEAIVQERLAEKEKQVDLKPEIVDNETDENEDTT